MNETASQPQKLRLGGMALRNGLLIHGPTAWGAAARSSDGSVEVACGTKPTFAQGRLGRAPLVRGPLRLAEAFAVIPIARRRLRTARLPLENPPTLVFVAGTAVLSSAIRRLARAGVVRESGLALLGLVPALAALRDGDLAAYHGVEHKAIGAYEKGSPDPSAAPKEHERCGSNLIAPLLILSVASQVLLERLLEEPNSLSRGVAAVAGASGAVEVFAYAERRPGSGLGRAVHAVGDWIQRLVATREPTSEQLLVGEAALDAVLRAEGQGPVGSMADLDAEPGHP